MFSFLKNIFLKSFFNGLYKKFQNQGWALISHAPHFLNVALPDMSVVYRISSFSSRDTVKIIGTIPPNAVYYSFYVYNDMGMPIGGYVDNDLMINHEWKTFRVHFKDLTSTVSRYSIIYRVYTTDNKEPLQPLIQINDDIIYPVPNKKVYETTRSITPTIINFLSRRDIVIENRFEQFALPPAQLYGLFPNPDSCYMVVFPKPGHVTILHGVLPPKIGRQYPLRFIGFMACDLKTTSTYASISNQRLKTKYKIYIATNKKEAVKAGWTTEDPLLLFPKEDDMNIIVYREVRTDRTGIASPVVKRKDANAAKKAMGRYYPIVQFKNTKMN